MSWRTGVAIFGPLGAAALVFLLQPKLARTPSPVSARGTSTLELPMPVRRGAVEAGTYDIVPTRGRFVLSAHSRSFAVRARSDQVTGWLRQGESAPDTLEVDVDLRTLDVLEPESSPLAGGEKTVADDHLRRLLGLSTYNRLRFAGRALMATAVAELPLHRVDWSGRISLGAPGQSFSMQLWHVALGNGRIHVQGTATVAGDTLDLPNLYYLGLLPDPVAVTLGFDLEFAARP